jgi:carbamoyl-phosphate synthase large subunit
LKKIENILITSAGRRVSLVKNFQESLKKFNSNGKVFTIDLNPKLSSACRVSDRFQQAPRVTDSGYIEFLKNFSIEHNISIIVPTIDTELSILAEVKEEFRELGVEIAISSLEICNTFYLKSTTEKFFTDRGFLTPKNLNSIIEAQYPIFAKLNNSSCSVGAEKVENFQRAEELQSENSNYVFQEFIDGDEFTVDVFVDRTGSVISVVPRQRLEVRAGEVSKALAVKDHKIIDEVKKIFEIQKGFYGTVTVQLFKRGDEIIFIEINPRFGGGYPLSYRAGSNFAELLIRDYLEEKLYYSEEWRGRTAMLRYDAEVIVENF